jgi:hypothetical protein
VTQDVDDDGLNELIYLRNDTLRCYDTLADASFPRAQTDVPYYSERRTGAEAYVSPPEIHNQQPLNDIPGFELSLLIVGILSILIPLPRNKWRGFSPRGRKRLRRFEETSRWIHPTT